MKHIIKRDFFPELVKIEEFNKRFKLEISTQKYLKFLDIGSSK